jgi:hypothetical protein
VVHAIRLAILVALAGCNQVFGVGPTTLPPPDALPTGCPAIGTPPQFSNKFDQVIDESCGDYIPSAVTGIALAHCSDIASSYIAVGPIDQPLAAVDVPADPVVNVERPRLLPEGDGAYIVLNNYDANNDDKFAEYRPIDATHWAFVADLNMPAAIFSGSTLPTYLGAPTRAPNRHVFVSGGGLNDIDYTFHELALAGDGTWLEPGAPYIDGDLVASGLLEAPNLTPDGLRMVFRGYAASGEVGIFYADRQTIDDRFTSATILTGVPAASDAYMTEDCTRIYFTGLGSIFYVRQI